MPQTCQGWKPASPTAGYLPEEPGKQAVWSQKKDKRKPDSWGPKCHRQVRLLGVLSRPSRTGGKGYCCPGFSYLSTPHSFKPNLNNQACYSPSTPLICQDWCCRMGIREHLARSSPREAAYGRGAATTPVIKHNGPGRKYLFVASTESEPSPHNILILTKINKFCWVGVLLIIFFPNQLYNC